MRARLLAPPVLVAALLALAGCGGSDASGTPTYTQADVEAQIVAAQKERTPAVKVLKAYCPQAIDPEAPSFTCKVEVGTGTEVPWRVRPGKGDYVVRNEQAVIDVAAVERQAAEAVKRPGATADCGGLRLQVLKVGALFGCRVTGGGGASTTVSVKVRDLGGHVTVTPAG